MNYKMTELDTQLREMALSDWPAFVELIGAKPINKAKICLMHKQQRTIRYMSYRTKMALETVREQCLRCSVKNQTGNPGTDNYNHFLTVKIIATFGQ